MLGHLDDGEVPLADGLAHLVEAHPERRVGGGRGGDRPGGDQPAAVAVVRAVGAARGEGGRPRRRGGSRGACRRRRRRRGRWRGWLPLSR